MITGVAERTINLMHRNLMQCPSVGDIHIALTGGTSGSQVTQQLRVLAEELPIDTWNRVHLWWSDERFVPLSSPERNDAGIASILGDFYHPDHVHRVAGSDQCATVGIAADLYSAELVKYGPLGPQFDITVLGLGPDGHIASLFPHSKQLYAQEPCIAVTDSPKAPPQRVTFTYSTLNRSELTVMLAAGEGKEAALAATINEVGSIEETPARGVSANQLIFIS